MTRRGWLAGAAATLAAPFVLRRSPARAAGVLRIGHVSPRTGPLAPFGETDLFVIGQIEAVLRDGIDTPQGRFAVEIINKDSQSNPNRAAEVAADLILRDRVHLLVAASTPDTVNPVADQAEIQEIPCLTTDCPWQSYFFGRGGRPETGFNWTYHFFFGFDDVVEAFLDLWNTVETNRRIGLILPNDTDGNAAGDPEHGVPPLFRAAGFEVVDAGRFPQLTNDFSAQIAAFKAADVDIVTGLMLPPDFLTFWTQAGQQGFRPAIVTVGKAVLFPSAVSAIGERAEGLATEVWWSPHHPFSSSLTGQSAAVLAASYREATGRPWTQPLGFKHALFEVAIDCLRRAADPTDPAAILGAIEATDYRSVVGHIRWTGDPVKNVCRTPVAAGQWRRTDSGFDLVVCANGRAPDIPVADQLRLLR